MKKKAFVRSMAAYQVPEDVLICFHNETTSGAAVAMVELTIIHCHSPRSICLLHRPDRQNGWGCILQVLDGGTDFCSLSRNAVLLLVYYFSR